jgi:hypothetical protein
MMTVDIIDPVVRNISNNRWNEGADGVFDFLGKGRMEIAEVAGYQVVEYLHFSVGVRPVATRPAFHDEIDMLWYIPFPYDVPLFAKEPFLDHCLFE